jgi:hypothetical protein
MFDTYKLNDQGFEAVSIFKNEIADTLKKIDSIIPEGREKSVFKMKLEEAVFFGTKAISAKPGNFSEVVNYGK